MDIPAISMAMANGNIMNQYSVAMLDKTLELNESNNAKLIDSMEAVNRSAMELSVNPNVGANFDMSV